MPQRRPARPSPVVSGEAGGECRLFDGRELPRHHGGEGCDGGLKRREGDDQRVRVREVLVFVGRMVMLRSLARIAAALPVPVLVPMGIAVLRRCLRVLMEHMHRAEPELDHCEAHQRGQAFRCASSHIVFPVHGGTQRVLTDGQYPTGSAVSKGSLADRPIRWEADRV